VSYSYYEVPSTVRLSFPDFSRTSRSIHAAVRKQEERIPTGNLVPDINMLPPSSPPPSGENADKPGYSPLKPYDASPTSIFRPPPSAALEVFNKPPSPSFRLAFRGQKLAEIPISASGSSLSSLPSSNSGLSAFMASEPTPLTAVSASLHPSAAESMEIDAGPSRAFHRATTPQASMSVIRATRGSLVSTDTSPYAIKKVIVKTGVRKGKAKQGPSGVPSEIEVCC
jgi:hypothetical protein